MATDVLVDTSVAVALVVADHPAHRDASTAAGRRRLGLSGHAAFETYSVLTRLPPPARRSPAVVGHVLVRSFPASRFLPEPEAAGLVDRFADLGVAGGAVYDALVGATALHHDLPLLTRDARAVETYRDLGVQFELLGG